MTRLFRAVVRQAGWPFGCLLALLLISVIYLAWSGRNTTPIIGLHNSGYLSLDSLSGAAASATAVTSTWFGLLVCSGFVGLVRGFELQHGASPFFDLYEPSHLRRLASRGALIVAVMSFSLLILAPAIFFASQTTIETGTESIWIAGSPWSWITPGVLVRWLLAVLLWWLSAELCAHLTANVIGTIASLLGTVVVFALLSNVQATEWLPVRWTALVVGDELRLNNVTAAWPDGGRISAVTLRLAVLVSILGAVAIKFASRRQSRAVEYTE